MGYLNGLRFETRWNSTNYQLILGFFVDKESADAAYESADASSKQAVLNDIYAGNYDESIDNNDFIVITDPSSKKTSGYEHLIYVSDSSSPNNYLGFHIFY